jgi:TolB-like protein/Flp pilus assembly protein TadD
MSIFGELQRRNVFRVTIGYVVSSWLLAQVADLVLENIGAPSWVMQSILLVLGLGFPIVVFFSWAYEVTPEGVKRESEIDRSQSITHVTGRKLDRANNFVLVIALSYLAVDKFFLTDDDAQIVVQEIPAELVAQDEAESDDFGKSIAVLPFVNMSADESSLYFSDGLADTVLHMLTQVRELRVAARTSSFQFRDQSLDVAKIGEQLNVATVLEGSVQRAGNKIRVTAQLIDVSNGYHLWSGNFDRELDDVFAIQDEIASEVVNALKISLLGETEQRLQRDQTDSLDAYTEYLLAVNDLNNASSETLASAIRHLQEAVRLDPDYSRAYAMLGRAYIYLLDWGAIGRSEAISAARIAASRSLDLAPDSAEALAVLGVVELRDSNLELAGQLLEKAIVDSPNNTLILEFYSAFLFRDARPDEGIATLLQLIRIDPLSESAHLLMVNGLLALNRYEEATEAIDHFGALAPNSSINSDIRFFSDYKQGNWANAISTMSAAIRDNPDPNDPDPEGEALLGMAYLAIGMPEEASRWYSRGVEVNAEHPVSLSAPLFMSYYRQEIDEKSVRLAQKLLADGIDNRNGARAIAELILIEYAEQTGRHDIPLEALDNLYPNLFDEPPHDLDKNRFATFLAGWALTQSGETQRGKELITALLKESVRYDEAYGAGLLAVSSRLVINDTEGALEKLAEVADDPFFGIHYRLIFERSSLYEPIRHEPAYIALLEFYETNAAQQRQLLEEMNL